MQFILNGNVFTIEDLDEDTNQAFIRLHAAYLGNQPVSLQDFKNASFAFFSKQNSSATLQDKFFTNFSILWRNLIANGRLEAAEQIWQMALQPALEWEGQNAGRYIHKGTPYYFWGVTCILAGDLDRGFALAHQSVEEDRRTSGMDFPDTPAFALATLNSSKSDQAFRSWVVEQARLLSERTAAYSNLYARSFTLDAFQRRFLNHSPNTDIIFLFVHTLARLNHLREVPEHALASAFAGQLETNLLFDLTLVLDAAIRAKNPTQWRFIDHATFLANRAGLQVGRDKFEEINREFQRDFDSTLRTLLNGAFHFRDQSTLMGDAKDLAIAYGLRNYAAHNVSTAATVWKEFRNIEQTLLNALFLTVEQLY